MDLTEFNTHKDTVDINTKTGKYRWFQQLPQHSISSFNGSQKQQLHFLPQQPPLCQLALQNLIHQPPQEHQNLIFYNDRSSINCLSNSVAVSYRNSSSSNSCRRTSSGSNSFRANSRSNMTAEATATPTDSAATTSQPTFSNISSIIASAE
jgi:hypothetical protein